MEISATELRQNLYKILDRVAEHGEEVVIRRKGKKIKISLEFVGKRSDRLIPHNTVVGNPEDFSLLEAPWEWNEEKNLDTIP